MGYADEQLGEIRRRKEADMEKTVFTSADLNAIKEAIDRKDQERVAFIREHYGDDLANGMAALFREPISNFSYHTRRSVDNEMIAREAASRAIERLDL